MADTEKNEERTTVRMSLDLHRTAAEKAEEMDRSLNWLICEAVREKVSNLNAGRHPWPPADETPVGMSTYQATLRWRMPAFDVTDSVVDGLMTALCNEIVAFGAEDMVDVDGPFALRPLRVKSAITTDQYREATGRKPFGDDAVGHTKESYDATHPRQ